MELIRGQHNLKAHHHGCIASIGNYDGVHRGHQVVVRQLLRKQAQIGSPATVVVFEPQPQEYFRPQGQPRLTSLREKLELLRQYGVERVLCLRFNHALAQLSATAFIDDLLVTGLGARHVVVGDDFRFGRGRLGDFRLLQWAGHERGFSVDHTETYVIDGERVSSTRVRAALAAGRLELAEQLLGRRYAISGRVVHGDKRGREWGFPTANIDMERRLPPMTGIFVVEVDGPGLRRHAGVASLGNRPTIDSNKTLLEVHLLNYSDDLYGRRIEVRFLKKLRDEEKFDSFDELKAQIALDTRLTERFFADSNG